LLGGRSWQVTYVDWKRRRCFVEQAESGGKARWTTGGLVGLGFELGRATRDVLLGSDPPVTMTRRAIDRLAPARSSIRANASMIATSGFAKISRRPPGVS
jgi:ATP-dependent Lhr-like helicase